MSYRFPPHTSFDLEPEDQAAQADVSPAARTLWASLLVAGAKVVSWKKYLVVLRR